MAEPLPSGIHGRCGCMCQTKPTSIPAWKREELMRLLPAEELLIGEDWWKSCHLGYGPWFIAHVHAPAPVNGPTPVHTEAVLTGLRGEEREEEEIKLWGGCCGIWKESQWGSVGWIWLNCFAQYMKFSKNKHNLFLKMVPVLQQASA